MEGQKQNEPLWLPRGSVRAIIVLGALFVVAFPVMIFVFRATDIPQGVKEIILFLAGGLIGLLKDYITQRSGEPPVSQ